jgi:tRNA:m4X modification enzyme
MFYFAKYLMQLLLIFVDIFQEKNANVIEFGSGRGLMSYWMAKASQLEAGQKFILVDKASHRHKYDNKLKDDNSHDIVRIRADIQDLVLDQIPQIKESSVR